MQLQAHKGPLCGPPLALPWAGPHIGPYLTSPSPARRRAKFKPAKPPRTRNRTGGEKKRMGINHPSCTCRWKTIMSPIPIAAPMTQPRNAPATTQPLWILGAGAPPEVGLNREVGYESAQPPAREGADQEPSDDSSEIIQRHPLQRWRLEAGCASAHPAGHERAVGNETAKKTEHSPVMHPPGARGVGRAGGPRPFPVRRGWAHLGREAPPAPVRS